MRMVFGLVLVLGLGLAGFAVYMAQGFISKTQAELELEREARLKMVPTVEVYVVNRALKYGEQLTIEDVQKIAWPENALPETVFKDEAELFPEGTTKPRTVVRAMEKFEPLLAVKVTEPGEDAGITSRLTKGKRAFAIKVDVTSGVSGFLRPGDTVDVYWSGQVEGNDMTKLIETGVKLIAIDQSADQDQSNPATIAQTVTVEASPQQVASLAQAQTSGKLSLSLVGAEDQTVSEAVQVDQNTLLGIEEQTIVQAEQQKVCTIRQRNGAEVVEIPIPCTN
jgi:pilus assembly protein CpaB